MFLLAKLGVADVLFRIGMASVAGDHYPIESQGTDDLES